MIVKKECNICFKCSVLYSRRNHYLVYSILIVASYVYVFVEGYLIELSVDERVVVSV